jgi:8-oxo-dGTP diphosphatase
MSKRHGPPMMACAIIEHTREAQRETLIAKLTRDPYVGKWTFPGGAGEPGEAPEVSLRRLLREQLGLNVEIIYGQPPFDQEYDGLEYRWRFFFCDATGQAINNKYYEEVRWVPRATLREYDFEPVSQRVVDWMLEED